MSEQQMSRYMSEVQSELQNRGAAAALSEDEQDLVEEYGDQEMKPEKCAERIIEGRAV